MKVEIDSYFEPDIAWLGEINRRARSLERTVDVFPTSTTQLICSLWHGKNSRSGITLTLVIASRELTARAEDLSPVKATKDAFEKLTVKVMTVIEECRRQGFWQRTSRDRFKAKPTLKIEPITAKDEVAANINDQLSELYNFVRREITLAQAQAELNRGDLAVGEVVDEVAMTALENYFERPMELSFRSWLLQLALDVLKRRKREIQRDSKLLTSVEIPASPAESSDVHDEIYDFYQPDSTARLKDLIPDGRFPTPEHTAAELEFQRHIHHTLAQLPRRWREAFILYSVEGLTLEEVARVLREPVDGTRRVIELARELLRTNLVEAGVRPAETEQRRETAAS